MAGTTVTSVRRLMLLSALFAVLLAGFGIDTPIVSNRSDAGRGGYWQCKNKKCGRVEWKPAGKEPRCAGVPGRQHATAETTRLTGNNIKPTDDDHYFF